jgi:7-keto-8-aminopelargonate synthetase-like enzyme
MSLHNFTTKLEFLKSKNLYRKLANTDFIGDVVAKRGGKKLVCFSSNDYLGLANNFSVKLAAMWAAIRFGASSRGSRYVCGNNSLHKKLEEKIAKINNCEDAIIFSSGYQAAIGAVPALVGEGDFVFADKLIHSSLLDGIKLSGAKMIRFKHNDLGHLRELLEKNVGVIQSNTMYSNVIQSNTMYSHQENQEVADEKKILIISEEIFSMDGDCCDAAKLKALAAEFGAALLIDSAHSLYDNGGKNVGAALELSLQRLLGAIRESPVNIQDIAREAGLLRPRPRNDGGSEAGLLRLKPRNDEGGESRNGRRGETCNDEGGETCNDGGCEEGDKNIVIKMGTFSKAIGSFGGYVAANKITIDYLRNFAKSQIYTTALPPSVLAASLQSLKIISRKNLAKKTLANVKYFCELMNLPQPQSAIIIIEINDNEKVLEIAKQVEEKGFLISAIRPPTVATSRLRITISAKHSKKHLAKLAQILQNILKTL